MAGGAEIGKAEKGRDAEFQIEGEINIPERSAEEIHVPNVQRQTAYKMAIAALEEEDNRLYAFDANLLRLTNLLTPSTKRNFIASERIKKAIAILEREMEGNQMEMDI